VRRLENVIMLLEERYAEPWTVESLALQVSVSESTLLRYFKRLTNTTPMSFLAGLRIAKARSLLLNTRLSVSEIGERVGFPDANYFTRTFKMHASVIPTQFRRQRG